MLFKYIGEQDWAFSVSMYELTKEAVNLIWWSMTAVFSALQKGLGSSIST